MDKISIVLTTTVGKMINRNRSKKIY